MLARVVTSADMRATSPQLLLRPGEAQQVPAVTVQVAGRAAPPAKPAKQRPSEIYPQSLIKENMTYIDNSNMRLGFCLSWGAALCHLGPSKAPTINYINTFDAGRLLQQSWYGDDDGSTWLGHKWVWNAVQGGCYMDAFENRGNLWNFHWWRSPVRRLPVAVGSALRLPAACRRPGGA